MAGFSGEDADVFGVGKKAKPCGYFLGFNGIHQDVLRVFEERILFQAVSGQVVSHEMFLKRTPTSDRMLAESELRYPYEGSKTLMHVFDSFDDKALILELLNGMYAELPEKKPKKAK